MHHMHQWDEILKEKGHRNNIRVYWEDADAAGVVYHSNYLRFAERSRTEMFRDMGLDDMGLGLQDGQFKEGLCYAIRSCQLDFLAPAYLDDGLVVHSLITHLRPSRMTFHQCITRRDLIITRLSFLVVCINNQFKVTRIPDKLMTCFEQSAYLV